MNPDSALVALSASLNGEGPAVEFLPGATNNDYLVNHVGEAELEGLQEIAAVVRTSGSTGTPKRAALSIEALASSSMATAEYLGFEGQWLLALPLHYVAGLFGALAQLVCGNPAMGHEPESKLRSPGLQ